MPRANGCGVDSDVSKYRGVEKALRLRGVSSSLIRRVNFRHAIGSLEEAIPTGAAMIRHLFNKHRSVAEAADTVGLSFSSPPNRIKVEKLLQQGYNHLAEFYLTTSNHKTPHLFIVSAASQAGTSLSF